MVATMGSRSDDVAEALLITGPCGAGKSTVGFACLTLLRAESVQAAMVDAELVYLSTPPAEDPHNELIAEQGLAAVYRVYRDAGIRRLLLPRVLLYQRHLELVSRAVPNASLTIAWLDVSDGMLAQRLEGRESGDSVRWHLDRARAVKQSGMRELADLQLNGERAPEEIAADLLAHLQWLPRLMGT
jgi:ribose 1,5-bisphosphokinase PhnN